MDWILKTMLQKNKLLELKNDDKKSFKDLSKNARLCLERHRKYVEMLCTDGSWDEYPLGLDFIRDECIVRLTDDGISIV